MRRPGVLGMENVMLNAPVAKQTIKAGRVRRNRGRRARTRDRGYSEREVVVNQRRSSGLIVMLFLLSAVLAAYGTLNAQTATSSTTTPKGWTPPRGPDGHPMISGVWSHNAATPMERPEELAGRAELTDDEVAALQRAAAEIFDGSGDAAFGDGVYQAALHNVLGKEKGFKSRDAATGNYNSFWVVDRTFEKRTSLITDPPDGRFPPLTPEAQKRRATAAESRKQHPFDGPEDIDLGQRCISGSVPMLGAGLVAGY